MKQQRNKIERKQGRTKDKKKKRETEKERMEKGSETKSQGETKGDKSVSKMPFQGKDSFLFRKQIKESKIPKNKTKETL